MNNRTAPNVPEAPSRYTGTDYPTIQGIQVSADQRHTSHRPAASLQSPRKYRNYSAHFQGNP
ncbi:MAG: hypothetical protein EOO90_16970 [Pedobacter sp.]|nr:MAG: hypothetical protein EOO90_16970 [Pedobacter sp.]